MMNDKLKTEATDTLFNAILQLRSLDECYDFFEDLCTVNELQSMSQRFEVAAMLKTRPILPLPPKPELLPLLSAE